MGGAPMLSSAHRAEENGTPTRGPYEIVAIAASAGGVQALSQVLCQLPSDFAVPIVVVQHLDPHHRSLLPEILARTCAVSVKQAEEGDLLRPRTAYIAPPDQQLLVIGDGTLSLSHSEVVHIVGPSADLPFESVAGSYRDRAIAVVVTGTGKDATMGVRAMAKIGGLVPVQDPDTTAFPSRPLGAIATGAVDEVLSLDRLPSRLVELVGPR